MAVSVSLFPPVTNNASFAGSSMSDRNFCNEEFANIEMKVLINKYCVKAVHLNFTAAM